MATTVYCIGLNDAAKRLKAKAKYTTQDAQIEEDLGVSWYTFYRWSVKEGPQRMNKHVLDRFITVYSQTIGRSPRIKKFSTLAEATEHLTLAKT